MKLNYKNKINIDNWFINNGIRYSGSPEIAFEYYKDQQFYGKITKSLSVNDICLVIKKQIDYIQKSIVNILYEQNGKSSKGLKCGYVYAIANKAWPDYIKIGSAIDVYDRLSTYQTSSPLRDFNIISYVYSDDRLALEYEIISKFNARNEWIECDIPTIKELFNNIKKYPEKEILKFSLTVAMNNHINNLSYGSDKEVFRSTLKKYSNPISLLFDRNFKDVLEYVSKSKSLSKRNNLICLKGYDISYDVLNKIILVS